MILYREKTQQIRLRIYNITTGKHEIMFDSKQHNFILFFSVSSQLTGVGNDDLFCLFDLILYVHSTIFQLCGTVLPGFNQY